MQLCYYCGTDTRPAALICGQCGQPLQLEGRYRIQRVLGQGGFAVVYEALDTRLDRRCAIKRVAAASLAEQRQIEEEAHILSQYASRFSFLTHIYDIWSRDGQSYLVMEYIDGNTLDQTPVRPWPASEVALFLRTVLSYLSQLHQAGIVHRDLKPKNIMLTADGRYVLLDFGIAKRGNVTLTAARAASLDYAAPEQLQGQPTDARSDLYSLAATAYELLCGALPPRADTRLVSGLAVPSPTERGVAVPPALQRTLMQMLALDPSGRPPHAAAALALLNTPAMPPPAPLPFSPAPPHFTPLPVAAAQPQMSPAELQLVHQPMLSEALPGSAPAQPAEFAAGRCPPAALRRPLTPILGLFRTIGGALSGGFGAVVGAFLAVAISALLYPAPLVEELGGGAVAGGVCGGLLMGALCAGSAGGVLRRLLRLAGGAFWGCLVGVLVLTVGLGSAQAPSFVVGLLGAGCGAALGVLAASPRRSPAGAERRS